MTKSLQIVKTPSRNLESQGKVTPGAWEISPKLGNVSPESLEYQPDAQIAVKPMEYQCFCMDPRTGKSSKDVASDREVGGEA